MDNRPPSRLVDGLTERPWIHGHLYLVKGRDQGIVRSFIAIELLDGRMIGADTISGSPSAPDTTQLFAFLRNPLEEWLPIMGWDRSQFEDRGPWASLHPGRTLQLRPGIKPLACASGS
jgi:hypothetical protein